MSLRRFIKDKRKSLDMTQTDLAKAARISQASVSRVETAHTQDIDIVEAARMLRVMGYQLQVIDLNGLVVWSVGGVR